MMKGLGFTARFARVPRAARSNPELARPRTRRGVSFHDVELKRGDRLAFAVEQLCLDEHRIGLIGDNGSGKSTMLRLINGLLLPNRGRVVAAGLDTRLHRKDLPSEVGFVFQNPDHQIIFPTVAEEVAFGPTERGLSSVQVCELTNELLARYGCSDLAHRNVNQLSGGQKQFICILAALAMEPSILLMDEPFASLDLPTRLALYRRMMELPQQIVIASHDFDLLASFDRVIWLQACRLRADGRPSEVLPDYRRYAIRIAANGETSSC